MDVERLEHGYSNGTRITEGVVEKRHLGPARHAAAQHEAGLLEGLADLLPVPRVLAYEPTEPLLSLELLEGVNGQALIERHLEAGVLRACGSFLRRLGTVDTGRLSRLSGEGSCLVHGDYGPQNLLLAADATEVLGIVDWEWARRGDPLEDLSWAEWIIRYHHPDSSAAVGALFDGYGQKPPWRDRHDEMLKNCDRTLRRAKARGNLGVIASWHERIDRTRRFVDMTG
jgi:tRNA A-37 threonylcarbamoyl transferase component Bud32